MTKDTITRSPLIPDLQRDLIAAAERLSNARAPSRRASRHVRRPALIVATTIAAVAAALLAGFAITGRPGDENFDVMAAVYRATAPRAGVLHVVFESQNTIGDAPGTRVRWESWSDPASNQARRIMRAGRTVVEQVSSPRRLL